MVSQQHPILRKQQEEMLTTQLQQHLNLQAPKNPLSRRLIASLDRDTFLSPHPSDPTNQCIPRSHKEDYYDERRLANKRQILAYSY